MGSNPYRGDMNGGNSSQPYQSVENESTKDMNLPPNYNNPELSNLGDLPSLGGNNDAGDKEKKKEKIKIASRSLIDAPKEYRCEIDGKVMTHPLRSPYGNVFEKKTLEKWVSSCGSVCPITGNNLRLEDCQVDQELKKKIIAFLKENMGNSGDVN